MHPYAVRLVLVLTPFATSTFAASFDGFTTNGSASLLSGNEILQLTPAQGGVGSAWAGERLNIRQDFSIAFSFLIDQSSFDFFNGFSIPADGITLTLHTGASDAIGGAGGFLGYAGPSGINNSVAFIFCTFDNGYETDGPGPNLSFATNGNLDGLYPNGGGSHPVDVNGGSLTEAILYSWVDYVFATDTFSLYLAETAVKPLSSAFTRQGYADAFNGAEEVLVGFTSATGGFTSRHQILSFSVTTGVPVPLPAAVWGLVSALPFLLRRRA